MPEQFRGGEPTQKSIPQGFRDARHSFDSVNGYSLKNISDKDGDELRPPTAIFLGNKPANILTDNPPTRAYRATRMEGPQPVYVRDDSLLSQTQKPARTDPLDEIRSRPADRKPNFQGIEWLQIQGKSPVRVGRVPEGCIVSDNIQEDEMKVQGIRYRLARDGNGNPQYYSGADLGTGLVYEPIE